MSAKSFTVTPTRVGCSQPTKGRSFRSIATFPRQRALGTSFTWTPTQQQSFRCMSSSTPKNGSSDKKDGDKTTAKALMNKDHDSFVENTTKINEYPTKVRPANASCNRVVITGSTKGLGLALAESFLKGGDCVCISSRSTEAVGEVVAQLQAEYGEERICGATCDVSIGDSVEALSNHIIEYMGGVDIWINNAGSNAYSFQPLIDFTPSQLEEVVLTNSLGTLMCSRAAIQLMSKQPEGGHIFLMEGAGSDGNATLKYAAYGYTKAGMKQLSKSLSSEVSHLPIGVHTLSPGMVATELLSSGRYTFGQRGRFFVNALAEPASVVSETVVPEIRALAELTPLRKNSAISFLTPVLALQKILRRVVLGENKDRYYAEKEHQKDRSKH
eukprot:CAMPEP_0197847992 /NCGR_PEP_ID=MMETSP1438-20131217/7713_1 /TAXON_ID=1461541 /ORGANISM="Pterosperma sp., Strain CCMP1384" /LENGTH=384 /DNA_ID=CAMNT_0043460093 /DNA_START=70 /DNA_END=1224 /DNA_ORIENTATION=+